MILGIRLGESLIYLFIILRFLFRNQFEMSKGTAEKKIFFFAELAKEAKKSRKGRETEFNIRVW